ncbi:MAG: class I SAM-dependent methyltransferase [Methanoregulaceae archaeon]|nr:class I SAM-dependent methyltransferase [Methanoregulaceae archaeon]
MMNDWNEGWSREYALKGRLWGGNPHPLPVLKEPSTVLDLGCGDGRAIPGMIGKGWSVIALDSSPQAVRLARAVDTTHRAMCVIGIAGQLPFRNEVFDAVFAAHLAGHLPESRRAELGRELPRVLLPGGCVFFRDFAVGDFREGRGEQAEPQTWLRKNGIATHYFTEPEVTALFAPLEPVTLRTCEWEIRVRGNRLPRREIEGVFRKEEFPSENPDS